jgi:hypothetical protein
MGGDRLGDLPGFGSIPGRTERLSHLRQSLGPPPIVGDPLGDLPGLRGVPGRSECLRHFSQDLGASPIDAHDQPTALPARGPSQPGHWKGISRTSPRLALWSSRHQLHDAAAPARRLHPRTGRRRLGSKDQDAASVTDRGSGPEMRDWKRVAIAADIAIFFCDPHAPWQRATKENTVSVVVARLGWSGRPVPGRRWPREHWPPVGVPCVGPVP